MTVSYRLLNINFLQIAPNFGLQIKVFWPFHEWSNSLSHNRIKLLFLFLNCEQSHHCVVFSFQVLPDGKGRKEEITPDWVHLHRSVQLTHDYSGLCPGKIIVVYD